MMSAQNKLDEAIFLAAGFGHEGEKPKGQTISTATADIKRWYDFERNGKRHTIVVEVGVNNQFKGSLTIFPKGTEEEKPEEQEIEFQSIYWKELSGSCTLVKELALKASSLEQMQKCIDCKISIGLILEAGRRQQMMGLGYSK
jgi:hypothetical protein